MPSHDRTCQVVSSLLTGGLDGSLQWKTNEGAETGGRLPKDSRPFLHDGENPAAKAGGC